MPRVTAVSVVVDLQKQTPNTREGYRIMAKGNNAQGKDKKKAKTAAPKKDVKPVAAKKAAPKKKA